MLKEDLQKYGEHDSTHASRSALDKKLDADEDEDSRVSGEVPAGLEDEGDNWES